MCITKLLQGDCLELMKKIPDNSIDLIVTDPPYDISCTNGGGSINNIKKLNQSLKQLDESGISNGYDIELFGDEFIRVLKDINIYLWCNKTQIYDYFNFYVGKHKCKFDIITWHKTNALPTYSNKYLTDTEYCLYFRKGGNRCKPSNYEDTKTFYIAPINHKDKKIYHHPTIKPLDITEKFIRNSSKENKIVLDPFMGSGTTGVACVNTNRNFIGMELDENYFNIAKNRIEKAKTQRNDDIERNKNI